MDSPGYAGAMFVKGLDSDDNAQEIIARLISSASGVEHVVLMSAVGVERAPDTAPRRALDHAR